MASNDLSDTPWWRRQAARLGWVGPRALAQLRRDAERAEERQATYAKLLGIVASAFVELDAEARVRRMAQRGPGGRFERVGVNGQLALWDLPGFGVETAARSRLLERLQRVEGCVGLPLTRERPDPAGGGQGGSGLCHMMLDVLPRHDQRGACVGFWGVLRDVTAQAETLQALAVTEGRFYELFHRIPNALVLHSGFAVLDANPAAIALFGYPDLHAMLGQNLLDCCPPGPARETAEARMAHLATLPAGASLPQSEYVFEIHGERRYISARSVRVQTSDGLVTLTILSDDTAHRQAVEAVARSEALLSSVVASSPDLICVCEAKSGVVHMVNRSFERLSGYRSEQVVGRTLQELGFWVDARQFDDAVARAQGPGASAAMRLSVRTAQGDILEMQLSCGAMQADGLALVVCTIRDVTENEQARLEYEGILRNASIGIALTRGGQVLRANPRLEAMLGWGSDDLIGQPEGLMWAAEARSTLGSAASQLALLQGEAVEIEQALRRRDGSVFWGRVIARAINPSAAGPGGVIWLIEDITERRQMAQALAKARDDAEAANRAKSAFLATTSHEIRTPLNALLGLARLARAPHVDEARRRQYIDHICDSAQTLSAILSDILDLSKMEAGKLHIEHRPFDLRSLLAALHDAYSSLADTAGLRFDLYVGADVPQHVVGDGARLRQILANYLTNALKFTRQGQIGLAAHTEGDNGLIFAVTDTGPGIAPRDKPLLFKPFSQADNSLTREVGGTGLGLSICHELAHRMGGEVGVDSQFGHGSRFWLRLPLKEAQGAAALAPLEPPAGQARRCVLVVEDNPVNMMITATLLQQWGYEVIQATTGREAIAAVLQAGLEQRTIDAVLMDLQMPDMSGTEVTQRLRQQFGPQELPIIALTAAALGEARQEALEAGMNDFLTKPIDPLSLRQALQRATISV